MKYKKLAILALIIIIGSIIIPQKIINYDTKPEVRLGYPVSFVMIDFTDQVPAFGGEYQQVRKFNILSGWEKRAKIDWGNFLLSYVFVFVLLNLLHPYRKKTEEA